MTISTPTRRSLLAASAIGGAFGPALFASADPVEAPVGAGASGVRPFKVNVPEDGLADMRRRIVATRWPERETVADDTQGVQLATMQALARYWASDYDWRKCEARLNALPQFVTEIDGLDVHFIHEGLSQAHPLQPPAQGRPLRRLGTAGGVHRRDAGHIRSA